MQLASILLNMQKQFNRTIAVEHFGKIVDIQYNFQYLGGV